MSKKIGLHIGGRRFDVDVEDDFAPFLEQNMAKDFNIDGNNDLKKMLHAYVKKTHEIFLQEKEIEKILRKTEI
ncbi:hypothetical protein SMGD1_1816 [Sulfurimonas gotlandica GD1]|jgi:hypothetical protein|uniref:Uncharacterized protein n=1 Tax=Sulfurimonas gotlandica (strain DSM 19862 / JCM 16533 / GD1) TaxID=929558 RepID=B6BII4_SULGG|nr:hypothetical protein [Sulfurimonas gotlandica]EDZ63242.1 conserved hypothetical protein [Sulfurimonas gotlandica GD1]EHP30339.1 hypothetical protein SMGD1_1816 [Sulfurimonas gotlandica GD1]